MLLLTLFAFIAGLVTILSPCILPVLPIVLSGSVNGGKKRPLGIVTGFIISFTFFTLLLSTIVKTTGLSADSLRTISVFVVGFFGISMIIPKAQVWMEILFSKLANLLPKGSQDTSFVGGVLIGLSLGLLWAPCVGPILASVITLAATSSLNLSAFFITLSYSIGTAIPLLGITYGGRTLLQKIPLLVKRSATIQKVFGVLMIVTALAIYLNLDRTFQTFILEKFPNYGVGLTKFEDIPVVKKALKQLTDRPTDESNRGRPLNELREDTFPMAPELIIDGQWFNSEPLIINGLKGKVVLIDFWTYTCINCIRTFPYLKSWHEKYAKQGLVIIGVHTPEFAFEKTAKNVERAIKDFGITYPVMQDNDYETWSAYENRYWPAKYLIDKNGRIRDTHFGEGAYDETEKMIQTLLKEAGAAPTETINNPTYQVYGRTPETYLGSERTDKSRYTLTGTWATSPQYAMPSIDATLTYSFDAAKVFLVMRPKGKSGKVQIYLDGTLQKIIFVDTDKLYTLIELPVPDKHELKLKFLDNNLELYAFTFG